MSNQHIKGTYVHVPKRQLIFPIGPSIAYIPLTKGQFAVIAAYHAPLVDKFTWHAWWNKKSQCYWAVSTRFVEGVRISYRLHSVIAGTQGTKLTADHVLPGTGLNCLPHNIRPATYSQQNMNQRLRKDNATGYRGVKVCGKRWRASICKDGVQIHLGMFDSPSAAYEVYCEKAREMFGEFARIA